MNLENLKFSDNTRFNVEDVEDYCIKGTFNPNATCDIEFYGYRETTFTVSCVESLSRIDNKWWPSCDETLKEFSHYYDDQITLIVQNAIDDKLGEV